MVKKISKAFVGAFRASLEEVRDTALGDRLKSTRDGKGGVCVPYGVPVFTYSCDCKLIRRKGGWWNIVGDARDGWDVRTASKTTRNQLGFDVSVCRR